MIQTEWPGGYKEIRLKVNGEPVSDRIVSLTYMDDINGGAGAVMLGSACAARIELTVDRPENAYTGAELSVAVAGVPLGTFTVTGTKERDGRLTVEAADAMCGSAMEAYYDPPAPSGTALGVIRRIAAEAGLELADASGIGDVPVAGLAPGCTRREMLGRMAAVLGRNAHIDRYGRLDLRWYESGGFAAGPDGYYAGGLEKQDADYAIERIECSVTTLVSAADEDAAAEQTRTELLAAGEGATGISIACPYMTRELLEGIYDRIGGFTYRPMTLTLYGDCRIETGDVLTVADAEGRSYTVPVMAVTHAWDGGVRTTVTAAGEPAGTPGAVTQGTLSQAVTRLTAELGEFRNLQAENITAVNARIDSIDADEARIGEAVVKTLETERVSASQIDFADYTGFHIPDENDGGTLRGGQRIEDGWMTAGTSFELFWGPCEKYRGRTICVSFEYRANDEDMRIWFERNYSCETDPDGEEVTAGGDEMIFGTEEEKILPTEPSYSAALVDGTILGNVTVGEAEDGVKQYTYNIHVGSGWNTLSVTAKATRDLYVRRIVVYPALDDGFGIGYASNIRLGTKGMQLGRYVVDRSGNATFGGDSVFLGSVYGLWKASDGRLLLGELPEGDSRGELSGVSVNGDVYDFMDKDAYRLVGGTEIPAYADVNDEAYLEPGTYYIPTNAAAATVANLPEQAAGRLYVSSTVGYDGSMYRAQQFYAYNAPAKPYTRYVNKESGSWVYAAWNRNITASDMGSYVPTSRTVNGKALSGNISLSAADVGATTASAVNSALSSLVKSATYTGTTTASGNLAIGSSRPILGTTLASSNIGVPYRSGSVWNVHVIKATAAQEAVVNTNMTVTYWYIDTPTIAAASAPAAVMGGMDTGERLAVDGEEPAAGEEDKDGTEPVQRL